MTALPTVQAALQLALDTASPDVRPSAECLARVAIDEYLNRLSEEGYLIVKATGLRTKEEGKSFILDCVHCPMDGMR